MTDQLEAQSSLGQPTVGRGLDGVLWWALAAFSAVSVAASSSSHLAIGSVAKIIGLPFLVVTMVTYRRRVPTQTNWALLGLFGVTALAVGSYFWSIEPSVTLSRMPTYVLLLVACVAVVMSLRTLGAEGVRAIAVGLMIGGLIAAVLVLLAEHSHTFISPDQYTALEERATAGAADPNDIALCMSLTMPIFMLHPRWLVKAMAIPVGTAVLLTGSRGGLIALAAVVASVVLIPVFSRPAQRLRRSAVGAHPIQTLFLVILTAVVGYQFLPSTVTQRLGTIPSQLAGGTLTNRTLLWHGAWQGFLHHPIVGIGIGATPTYELSQTGYFLVAHNVNLSLLLELGLAGWTFFMVSVVPGFLGAGRARFEVPWLLPSLIGLVVGSYALSWEYNKMLWLLLVLGGFLASVPKTYRTKVMFGTGEPDAPVLLR